MGLAFLAGTLVGVVGATLISAKRDQEHQHAAFAEAWAIHFGCVREFQTAWEGGLADRVRSARDPLLNEVLQAILKPLATGAHVNQVLERDAVVADPSAIARCPDDLLLFP